MDIEHPNYLALCEPDTAFWSLVEHNQLAETLTSPTLWEAYRIKSQQFVHEMDLLRSGIKPSAVYFNPTERCNLNCSYCYIPEKMRRQGRHMSTEKLLEALERLKTYFADSLPKDQRPQIVFHGVEPMLNREAVFSGIQQYHQDFCFGVQTNATLLDQQAVDFLVQHEISIGLSLDGAQEAVCDRTRSDWMGRGVFKKVVEAMGRLGGYHAWSVIGTLTRHNLGNLIELVDFLHDRRVPSCLLNVVRCTLEGGRVSKPEDAQAAHGFIQALERVHALYENTGRKLVVANFANILLAIIAPTARRLMCDISPCGGGRCFFALAPNGDLFPCSEFIGLSPFKGGNLFADDLNDVLESDPFKLVTSRRVEHIQPCARCAIRHYCGAPCPAEAHQIHGGMHQPGAFCEFYEKQVRYAFRLIADQRHADFLWDDWDQGTETTFDLAAGSIF